MGEGDRDPGLEPGEAVEGESHACVCCQMASSTRSSEWYTASFVTRTIRQDCERRYASRRWSYVRLSLPCVAPSTSITSRARMQAKSTMYGPMGCCRRKRIPPTPSRNRDQRIVSALVRLRRCRRARTSVLVLTYATQLLHLSPGEIDGRVSAICGGSVSKCVPTGNIVRRLAPSTASLRLRSPSPMLALLRTGEETRGPRRTKEIILLETSSPRGLHPRGAPAGGAHGRGRERVAHLDEIGERRPAVSRPRIGFLHARQFGRLRHGAGMLRHLAVSMYALERVFAGTSIYHPTTLPPLALG